MYIGNRLKDMNTMGNRMNSIHMMGNNVMSNMSKTMVIPHQKMQEMKSILERRRKHN